MKRNDRLRRFVFVVLLAVGAPLDSMCADVWPSPGICFYIPPGNSWWSLPDSDKGTVLVDLGLFETCRRSTYGLSLALGISSYKETMVGAQMGLLWGTYAKDAYGFQSGLFNSADAGSGAQVGLINGAGQGYGVQMGLVNVYDDVSMRLQVGSANTHKFILLGHGESRHPGGNGAQVGFLNVSSEGGHLQLGVFNLAYKSGVLQVGLYNSMDGNSRGLQIGIVNERGDDESTPFIGWCW